MSAAPTDQDLSSLLRVVQGGDDADSLLDNGAIASLLGLSQETVAEQLAASQGAEPGLGDPQRAAAGTVVHRPGAHRPGSSLPRRAPVPALSRASGEVSRP